MEREETKNDIKEPFTAYGRYSYADYLTWQLDEMVELIKGKVFKAAAAPRRKHQEVSLKIASQLYYLLKKRHVRFLKPHLMFGYLFILKKMKTFSL